MEALDGVIQALFAGYSSERDSGIESDESNGSGVVLDACSSAGRAPHAARAPPAARRVLLPGVEFRRRLLRRRLRAALARLAAARLGHAAVSLVNVASDSLEEALEDSIQRPVFVISGTFVIYSILQYILIYNHIYMNSV